MTQQRAKGELCHGRIVRLRPDGTDRCRRIATHLHDPHTAHGSLPLCTQHLQALLHREKLGSASDMLAHWEA